jgi:hypothetical protein
MPETSLLGLLAGVLAGLLYSFPFLLAACRDHHHTLAIAVLTVLTGWTGVGWLIALGWSLGLGFDPTTARMIWRLRKRSVP